MSRLVPARQPFSCLIAYTLLAGLPIGVSGQEVQPDEQPRPVAKAAPAIAAADELMLFQDMPVVVSATRQAQPLHFSPVPVSIVTGEDIHYGGHVNVAEVLQFYPGMSVLRLDRNRYAVGVRGFHHTFSDRTLLLIDGRNASDIFVGSIDPVLIPLLMEDIERIEVVRGPAGAAWGANALNGVINIMTKDPRDTQGVLLSGTLNEYGDLYSHVRWGSRAGDLAWRFSAGYEDHESSEDAITNDTFESRDFARRVRLTGDAVYEFDPDTRLRFGLGYLHSDQGDFGFALSWPMRDERREYLRSYAKLEHSFSPTTSGYVQLYANTENSNQPATSADRSYEIDLEGQITFVPAEHHTTTVGANARLVNSDPSWSTAEQIFYDDDPYREYWVGAFVLDRWRVTERFTFEPQLRIDDYTGTGTDWSGRITGLYALDSENRHILRASAARAFRAPLPGLRDAAFRRVPLPSPPYPPGLFGLTLLPSDNLENERIWTVEAGYTGQLTEQVTLRVNSYQSWYEDLIGVGQISAVPGVYQLVQTGDAEGRGVETELDYSASEGGVSLWYALNDFEPGSESQDIRAFFPSKHNAGIRGRVNLPWEMIGTANYRWAGHTGSPPLSGSAAGNYHLLDLTLAKHLEGGRGEVMMGVHDVLDQTDMVIEGVGAHEAHETPGRTFFVRLQLKF